MHAIDRNTRRVWGGPDKGRVHRLLVVGFMLGLAGLAAISISRRSASLAIATQGVPAAGAAASSTGRLYIISRVPRSPEDVTRGSATGRFAIVDPATGQAVYTSTPGTDIDVAAVPDGTRVYVAAVAARAGLAPDYLFAVDPRSGKELWRVELKDRMKGLAASGLALAPDGRRLYYYSYPWLGPDARDFWITTIDTATGRTLPATVTLPACFTPTLRVAPDGAMLYVACLGTNDVRFVDLRTSQVAGRLRIPGTQGDPRFAWRPGGIAGMIVAPDGRMLYVVTDQLQVARIDLQRRVVAELVDLRRGAEVAAVYGSVARTADGGGLIVGLSARKPADGTVSEARVFDLRTWRVARRVAFPRPLLATTLAMRPDGAGFYGVAVAPFPRAASTLVRAGANGGQADALMVRPGEDIARLFVGP